MRPVLESEYCNAYAHGLTISGQCKCILPCTDSMCVCENCRKSKDKTDNDQLLDNYIQQVSDQQNQIGELQKIIMELRSKVEENKRNLILKDIERIFDDFLHIPDGTTTLKDDLVDYILERENK